MGDSSKKRTGIALRPVAESELAHAFLYKQIFSFGVSHALANFCEICTVQIHGGQQQKRTGIAKRCLFFFVGDP